MTSFDPNNHTTKSNNSNKYAQEEEEFEVVKPDDLLQIDLNKCSDVSRIFYSWYQPNSYFRWLCAY